MNDHVTSERLPINRHEFGFYSLLELQKLIVWLLIVWDRKQTNENKVDTHLYTKLNFEKNWVNLTTLQILLTCPSLNIITFKQYLNDYFYTYEMSHKADNLYFVLFCSYSEMIKNLSIVISKKCDMMLY